MVDRIHDHPTEGRLSKELSGWYGTNAAIDVDGGKASYRCYFQASLRNLERILGTRHGRAYGLVILTNSSSDHPYGHERQGKAPLNYEITSAALDLTG